MLSKTSCHFFGWTHKHRHKQRHNKPAKVKKSTIIALIDQGGLNIVDVNADNKAAKIGWIRRIIENNNPKCSQILLQMLHMD